MNQRYYSLDVFRGATVALMILVNNPGSWSHIFSPLEHATWHGCTPTDLVFPFFLFAVGNSLAFVVPRYTATPPSFFLKKVFRRFVLIFAIGIFLNWSPFVRWDGDHLAAKTWESVRIFGVLQRIAFCYLLAGITVYLFKPRTVVPIAIVALLLYWLLCIVLANNADPYSLPGFFGTKLDLNLLGTGHIYKGEGVPFDPEGPSSTLPAVVQVIAGFLAGTFIRNKGKSPEMLSTLFVAGSLLVFVGYAWDMVLPINKKLWTSSYVLYTTGIALLVLGVLIYMLELRKSGGNWSRFFDVFGKNPLFIFVLSGFLPRVLALFRWTDHVDNNGNPVYTSALPWVYNNICKPLSTDLRIGSLVFALLTVAFYWIIAYLLDRRRIYIKV